jgi:hypothetical protein
MPCERYRAAGLASLPFFRCAGQRGSGAGQGTRRGWLAGWLVGWLETSGIADAE